MGRVGGHASRDPYVTRAAVISNAATCIKGHIWCEHKVDRTALEALPPKFQQWTQACRPCPQDVSSSTHLSNVAAASHASTGAFATCAAFIGYCNMYQGLGLVQAQSQSNSPGTYLSSAAAASHASTGAFATRPALYSYSNPKSSPNPHHW
jgi:hypothetical protein